MTFCTVFVTNRVNGERFFLQLILDGFVKSPISALRAIFEEYHHALA